MHKEMKIVQRVMHLCICASVHLSKCHHEPPLSCPNNYGNCAKKLRFFGFKVVDQFP